MERLAKIFEDITGKKISRRTFIKLFASGLAVLPFYKYTAAPAYAKEAGFNGRIKKNIKADYDLVSCEGDDPFEITKRVIEKLGGMSKFVSKGGFAERYVLPEPFRRYP